MILKEFLEFTSRKKCGYAKQGGITSLIGESLLPGWSLLFLKRGIKNMLPRSSEDGCLLFLMRLYGINGVHKLVCFNN